MIERNPIFPRKLTLALAMLAGMFWSGPSAHAQTCAQICQQYYAYARSAGAPGTFGMLTRLYNACMRCQNSPRTRRYECAPGYYLVWIDGRPYCYPYPAVE